ncbi:MAG TPA: hypothetical protein VLL52_15100 [Anaerolineae bacterium]|nr:hypothetical protein [Anaerolineae bacterium]
MANQSIPGANAIQQEMQELRSRLEWLEDERRKANRRSIELEQRITLQEREIKTREQRIRDLEQKLNQSNAQISRLTQVDVQLKQFKDEMVAMIEQYDQRRILAAEDAERMTRLQHEFVVRELADIRKELPPISRLEEDMGLRQAEEARLANLISVLQTKTNNISNRVETWSNDLAYLGESERHNQRYITDIQTTLMDINKRWEPIHNRLDVLANSISKVETRVESFSNNQNEAEKAIKEWSEQIVTGEYERNKQVEEGQRAIAEFEQRLSRFTQEWVGYVDQYKEAKMAVQSLEEFQRQLEQQQRDTDELVRIETHRMQSRWDNFIHENEQRWQTFGVDDDQRWSLSQRQFKQLSEQLLEVDEALERIEQDKDTLWRIQTAQADAMRQIPRIWLEEVEKAKANNPHRRRQPALVPVNDEDLG